MNGIKSTLRIGLPLLLLVSVLCSAIALPLAEQQKSGLGRPLFTIRRSRNGAVCCWSKRH